MKVLAIDAWCDGQNCIECGSHRISDTTKGTKVKCDSCLTEFNENEGKTWTWNNWFNVGTYQGNIDNDETILRYFFDNYFTQAPWNGRPKSKEEAFIDFKEQFYIDDDQFNVVLRRKHDDMPQYAIEYGGQI